MLSLQSKSHFARSLRTTAAVIACASMVTGCATAWQSEGVFTRTAETQLEVESSPPSKLYLDNKLAGEAPIKLTLQYEQDVERKTRKVTYWQTQPGLALLITLLSLGFYLPFSAIPVDTDTSLELLNTYSHNHFQIAIEAAGYARWQQEVVANGEPTMHLQAQLAKGQAH